MSNLLYFIGAIAIALVFAALIDRIPSLPTLPRSYIYTSSVLFVCVYKLLSALPNLFNDGQLGGLFFSAFADNISSRLISWLIDHFPSFKSNRGQMNGGKSNNSQSSEGQINGDEMNGVLMNGGEMINGMFYCTQRSGGHKSSGVQQNGIQMNGGHMTNSQLNIEQYSKVAKANIK